MKKLIIILICILFTCSSAAFSKEKDTTVTLPAKNIVYIEGAGLAYSYLISINYERIFEKWFSIRFGYGYYNNEKDFLGLPYTDGEYNGMNIMINFHNTGNNKINIGTGVSFGIVYDHYHHHYEFFIFPSLCLTYRYQPLKGGIFISIGVTIAHGISGGLSIGIGRVF